MEKSVETNELQQNEIGVSQIVNDIMISGSINKNYCIVECKRGSSVRCDRISRMGDEGWETGQRRKSSGIFAKRDNGDASVSFIECNPGASGS